MTLTRACSLRPVGGLELLAWDAIEGAEAYVTTRSGGVSAGPYESLNLSLAVGDDPAAVRANRARVAAALGADRGDFVFVRQVHGAGVLVAGAADRGTGTLGGDEPVPAADVLVTTDPSVVLAVLAADCVPIVLHDPVARVLACVHAGWRGTVAGAPRAAVEALTALGAVPARVVAGIGPAIGADRYQVGDEVAEAARAAFRDFTPLRNISDRVLRPDAGAPGPGKWLFDLPAACRLVLRAAGLASGNIHTTEAVTGEGTFFSDRSARPCGRHALVARLQPGGTRQ